jgi:hypothetical protein
MKLQNLFLACLLALGATSAMASEPANQVVPMTVNASTREDFAAVADEVRLEMQTGGRFEYVTKDERAQVETGLARMASMFDSNPSVDAMNKEQQVALFNQQEVVNAILKNRDSSRVVCKREKKTGSNLSTTTCLTYGERERIRRDDQKELNRIQKGGATSAY